MGTSKNSHLARFGYDRTLLRQTIQSHPQPTGSRPPVVLSSFPWKDINLARNDLKANF